MEEVDYQLQGKQNRRKGADWELKVRKDLIVRGWTVAKWNNTVKDGEMRQSAYNKFRNGSTGFPDFIAFKKDFMGTSYEIKWVECKISKYVSKDEKTILNWMTKKEYHCQIAYKDKSSGEIIYDDYTKR